MNPTAVRIQIATEALDFCKSQLKECKGKADIKRAATYSRRIAAFELAIAELSK